MYKIQLCLRYLRTRFSAFASIASVMLGVAALIVVNAVMAGFTHKMEGQIHGVMGDLVIMRHNATPIYDANAQLARVRRVIGDDLVEATPVLQANGMLAYETRSSMGRTVSQPPVQVIGIDPKSYGKSCIFAKYLNHSKNRQNVENVFTLHENGYDTKNYLASKRGNPPVRPGMDWAGMERRRGMFERKFYQEYSEAKKEEKEKPANTWRSNNNGNYTEAAPILRDAVIPTLPVATTTLPEAPVIPDVSSPVPDAEVPFVPATTAPRVTLEYPVSEYLASESFTEPSVAAAAPAPLAAAPTPAPLGPAAAPAPLDSANDTPALLPPPPMNDPAVAAPATESSPAASLNATFGSNNTPQYDDPYKQHEGIVMGVGLAMSRPVDGKQYSSIFPGDDTQLTVLSKSGSQPKGVTERFTVTDFYESKMAQFDQRFVFVPLARLQELLGLVDPADASNPAKRGITHLQIKLREGADLIAVRDRLRKEYADEIRSAGFIVNTWRDQEQMILDAVALEKRILNVLLFLSILVAGFGIFAIFRMIVMEKTPDIGILKSLGASKRGIAGIFLSYGLALGIVGGGLGITMGLIFLSYINEIADLLAKLMGQPVFDPSIYNFYEIPTHVNVYEVMIIFVGAILVALISSFLPAVRAARMQPLDAIRS